MSAADKYSIPTVQQIEEAVGMGAAGWDMVDPNSIIDAVVRLMPPTQGADALTEAQEWISELKRAHVYIDQGKPFLSGKDCREIAELIERLLATLDASPSVTYEMMADKLSADGYSRQAESIRMIIENERAVIAPRGDL